MRNRRRRKRQNLCDYFIFLPQFPEFPAGLSEEQELLNSPHSSTFRAHSEYSQTHNYTMDSVSSETCNTIGNVAFCEKLYDKAVRYYTIAISKNPQEAKYFCNRSAAYLCMNKKDEALRDVNHAVSLNPQWDRSYSRQASVLFSLRKWTDTIDACKKGLQINPNNAVLKQLLVSAGEKKLQLDTDYNEGRLSVHENVKRENESDEEVNTFINELNSQIKPLAAIERRVTNDDILDKLTPQDIINRFTGPNSEWRALNPFWVLMLPYEANSEDVKQRFNSISKMIHPDLCKLPNSRQAFEVANKAKKMLLDNKIHDECYNLIAETIDNVRRERKRKILKGQIQDNPEDISFCLVRRGLVP